MPIVKVLRPSIFANSTPERHVDVVTGVISSAFEGTLQPLAEADVLLGTELYTDKLDNFSKLHLKGYTHKTVNDGADEHVGLGDTTAKHLKSFWTVLEHGINGVHIEVSRYSFRQTPDPMLSRLMALILRRELSLQLEGGHSGRV